MHFHQWKRREFITLLGGAAVAWPLAARAQQGERVRRIGVLLFQTPDEPETQKRFAAFAQGLQEAGWIEGRNLRMDQRWGMGDADRTRRYATDLIALAPDVILCGGVVTTQALRRATRTVPIVFGSHLDPVGSGVVASLARPGGNITGFTGFEYATSAKWLQLLKELVPPVMRVAVLRDPETSGGIGQWEAQTAARTLGLEVVTLAIRQAEDIAPAFEAHKGDADALFVGGGPLTTTNQHHINTLALVARLPTISVIRENAEAGALMSYGPHFPSLFRRAADYVDKVLRGAKPAEIPVEQPTKFELVINLKTAKTLGLEVPPTLLARADEVIE